ncbi:MAG: amidohydrolase family protein [Pirellulales bacterium]|nr:amidohydrolase family protein [Pirellulales bacterium]
MELTARRYDSGRPVRIVIEQSKISRIELLEVTGEEADSLPWVAPGLIDIQVNGYGGQEFSSPTLTPEAVYKIARQMDSFGVTRFFPTVTTQHPDVMLHAVAMIARACDEDPATARRIPGIHVEGPFLSREDGPRGAHPIEFTRPPDWDEFQRLQEAAGGRIRIHTLSPEYDNAPEFIRQVVRSGVLVALGHTSARADQIRAAVDAGARLSTHLGNGAHAVLPRHHNYLWAQLADDRLAASLIADGHHLPPSVVKTFLRAKGPERCVLVSDLSGLAGLPPGRHASEMCEVEILDSGKLVVAGQTEVLAGASVPLGTCVANVIGMAGLTLREAVDLAVTNPARLVGLNPSCLEPGSDADLVLFHLDESDDPEAAPKLTVRTTVLAGEVVHDG